MEKKLCTAKLTQKDTFSPLIKTRSVVDAGVIVLQLQVLIKGVKIQKNVFANLKQIPIDRRTLCG